MRQAMFAHEPARCRGCRYGSRPRPRRLAIGLGPGQSRGGGGAGGIRIGTRGSALARAQTSLVASLLPDVEIETVVISTGGDRSQSTNRPTPDWGSGVF